MLEVYTTELLFQFLLVFCRVGAVIMLMPAIGEAYVSPRIRLLFSILLSFIVLPMVMASMMPVPSNLWVLISLVGGELLIGVFFGLMIRVIISALHTAGMIIAYQSSLAAAMLFDANQGTQSSVTGNFLMVIGVLLFFALNLHHLILSGIVESYSLITIGRLAPVEDFANVATRSVSTAFLVAMKLASAHIIIGLLLYLGAGILARLMPSMQIFFIMMPLQIMVSFAILSLTVSVGMMWFMQHFESSLVTLFGF